VRGHGHSTPVGASLVERVWGRAGELVSEDSTRARIQRRLEERYRTDSGV
jgi:hypothetical protein